MKSTSSQIYDLIICIENFVETNKIKHSDALLGCLLCFFYFGGDMELSKEEMKSLFLKHLEPDKVAET